MKDCVFCKIAKGEIPSEKVFESENTIVIKDINPKAETHLLVIPRKHIPSFQDVKGSDLKIESEMLEVARKLVKEKHLESRYKIVFNGGGFIEVDHLHLHVLGGNFRKK